MITGFEHYKKKWRVNSENIIKPGLDAMKEALALLGNPERGTSYIHVAGTNGKGSTIAFLESILCQHGKTVGKFMSPCILDVHDQIQINSEKITAQEMDGLFQEMREAGLDGKCTDFELLTCAAFLHFQKQHVDIVLIEAGMGGLLDSTNVITPLVSIIPSISLEHTNFLGNTLTEIAAHKAGIIKQEVPVVVGKLSEEAMNVVKLEAEGKNAPLYMLGEEFTVEGEQFLSPKYQFSALERRMPGTHQGENMALAIMAFLLIADNITTESVRKGVALAALPGRFEEVLPNVYFDGAHNPASAEKLVATIQEQFPYKNIEFVIGMLADKDVDAVLRIFETVSTTFTFVSFENERAMEAIDLMKKSRAVDRRIIHLPAEYLQEPVEKGNVKIVTGSLYLLAALRAQLTGEK